MLSDRTESVFYKRLGTEFGYLLIFNLEKETINLLERLFLPPRTLYALFSMSKCYIF